MEFSNIIMTKACTNFFIENTLFFIEKEKI